MNKQKPADELVESMDYDCVKEPEICIRCNAEIKDIVWLEFDQRTSSYTDQEIPDEFNQGAFPFGRDCAKKELSPQPDPSPFLSPS